MSQLGGWPLRLLRALYALGPRRRRRHTDEVRTYKHAFETTAADRDRLKAIVVQHGLAPAGSDDR